MKNLLSVEQSATLIAKGISADKASMCQLYSDYDGEIIDPSEVFEDCGKLLAVVDDEAIEVNRDIVPKDSDFDHSFADDMPIFTLADLLSILPKKITFGHRTNCRLKMQPIISAKDATSEVWQACYLHTSLKANAEADELIDSLYEILLWAIDNGYIDLPK